MAPVPRENAARVRRFLGDGVASGGGVAGWDADAVDGTRSADVADHGPFDRTITSMIHDTTNALDVSSRRPSPGVDGGVPGTDGGVPEVTLGD